jgi:hypothetical protein
MWLTSFFENTVIARRFSAVQALWATHFTWSVTIGVGKSRVSSGLFYWTATCKYPGLHKMCSEVWELITHPISLVDENWAVESSNIAHNCSVRRHLWWPYCKMGWLSVSHLPQRNLSHLRQVFFMNIANDITFNAHYSYNDEHIEHLLCKFNQEWWVNSYRDICVLWVTSILAILDHCLYL